jgi:hypothetical protein
MDSHSHLAGHRLNWSRINQWLLWVALAGAVGWLFFRDNEHLVRLVPFLLVLACPLMHLFGHHHRHHRDRPPEGDDRATRDTRD